MLLEVAALTCKHIIVYTRPNSATLVSPGNAKTALVIYRFPHSNLCVMTRINLQLIHQFSTLEKDVCLVPAELSNRRSEGISSVKVCTVLLLDLCAVLVAST